jgi:hypothetical protein
MLAQNQTERNDNSDAFHRENSRISDGTPTSSEGVVAPASPVHAQVEDRGDLDGQLDKQPAEQGPAVKARDADPQGQDSCHNAQQHHLTPAEQAVAAWAGSPPASGSQPSSTPFFETKRDEVKHVVGYDRLKVGRPATDEEYLDYLELKAAYYDKEMSEDAKKHREERQKQQEELARQLAEVSVPKPLLMTRMSDVKLEPLHWLVPGYIPLGKLVGFAGHGGKGKSTVTLDLAAKVTRGQPAFGLNYPAPEPASVLLCSLEDGVRDTILPRLIAAGADLERVHHAEGTQAGEGQKGPFFLCRQHLANLEATLDKFSDIRLVVIDPISAFLGPEVNEYREADVRAALDPVAEMADKRKVSIVFVKHFNKNTRAAGADRVAGARAFVNVARAFFLFGNSPDDAERLVMAAAKFNLSTTPPSLAYRVEAVNDLDGQRDVIEKYGEQGAEYKDVSKQLVAVRWEGPANVTADDVADASDKKAGQSKQQQCTAYIVKLIGGQAWPLAEIEAKAKEAGFSAYAIRHAKEELEKNGNYHRHRDGMVGSWWFGKGTPSTWAKRPESAVAAEPVMATQGHGANKA